MTKRFFLLVNIMFILFVCVGCFNKKNKQNVEHSDWKFSEKVSRCVCDDGWVYSFEYQYLKDGEDPNMIPFVFYGVNLRYRYNEHYTTTITKLENGEQIEQNVPQVIQIFGCSDIPEEQAESQYIDNLLGVNCTDMSCDKLLQLDKKDIELNILDVDMFYNMIHSALEGEEHKEGKYYNIPCYALLTEPEFTDGYAFQIGFVSAVGCVDVMFIDILYRTGNEYNSYIQLSDMVQDNCATKEQMQMYDLLNIISNDIVSNNDFLTNMPMYMTNVIDGIDFSRLAKMINSIENNTYFVYVKTVGN